MSRGKGRGPRKRRTTGIEHAPPDSVAAMKALGSRTHLDRVTMVPKSERRADGMPPQDVVDGFLERAKSEGCVCKPEIIIHRSAAGGGAIALGHEDYCPLIRVLDEQKAP